MHEGFPHEDMRVCVVIGTWQATSIDENELKSKKANLNTHLCTMEFIIDNFDKSLARFRSIMGN